MKHDAIVNQGMPILERVPIPDELVPADSRVEIDAKIGSGYCKTQENLNGQKLTLLQSQQAKSWILQSFRRYMDVHGRMLTYAFTAWFMQIAKLTNASALIRSALALAA